MHYRKKNPRGIPGGSIRTIRNLVLEESAKVYQNELLKNHSKELLAKSPDDFLDFI